MNKMVLTNKDNQKDRIKHTTSLKIVDRILHLLILEIILLTIKVTCINFAYSKFILKDMNKKNKENQPNLRS